MILPRPTTINNTPNSPSSSSSSSSSSSDNNIFVLVAFSLLSLFRCIPSSTSSSSSRVSLSVSAMRGAGASRPPPLSTSTTSTSSAIRSTKTLAFSTPESLSEWLRPRLPSDSFASWGVKPGTKTVHNLWLELYQGETSLRDDSTLPSDLSEALVLRTVHVATVLIRNSAGAMLVESHQLLSDGTVRYRRRPLSEKMKPGETVEDAATRAVLEELGPRNVRILPGTYVMKEEERVSVSYPGLPARYLLHSVEAEVDGLPEEGEFSTEEYGEGCQEEEEEEDERNFGEKVVFVKKHFWKWVFGDLEGTDIL